MQMVEFSHLITVSPIKQLLQCWEMTLGKVSSIIIKMG